jgi:hypothetical protein
MTVPQAYYEELLAQCSHYAGALALLKHHRPYLETLPSMRRPHESIVPVPLPNIRIRVPDSNTVAKGPISSIRKVVSLPCDIALLMCDPEWKIKTGVEIFIFIHRPDEDFSDILSRWRQTQVLLNGGYEWLMPTQHEHLLNEGVDAPYPLFVVFAQTPERIIRGLKGAGLPVIVHTPDFWSDPEEKAKAAQQAAKPTATDAILADTLLSDAVVLEDSNPDDLEDVLKGALDLRLDLEEPNF